MPEIFPHALLDDAIVIKSENFPSLLLPPNDETLKDNDSHEVLADPFVIVGSHCGAAVLRGADIFAPGIIGAPHGITPGKTNVNIIVDIKDKTLKGTITGKSFQSKYYSSASKNTLPPNFILIGSGIALMSRQDLFQSNSANLDHADMKLYPEKSQNKLMPNLNVTSPVSGIAVKVLECIFDGPSLNDSNLKDMYMLQNLPSLIVGHALMDGKLTKSSAFELVLDMCAAPGGKTTHIASLLSRQGGGTVIAIDKSQNKVNRVLDNCRRFGVDSYVEALVRDSTKLLSSKTNNVIDDDCGRVFKANMFDRILLDAPCSALGQRPQFNISMKPKELASFPKIQKKLFDVAYKLLKPGGFLVYSTCTFTIEENEGLVRWAMETYAPALSVIDITSEDDSTYNGTNNSELNNLSSLGRPGIDLNCGHPSDFFNRTRRFGFSNQKHDSSDVNFDTIGFFVVKFKKNS